jgi:superfamily II DNA or RNA helicase
MDLRPYQRAAIDAIYDYFGTATGNPLVVMPTGTGKSVVLAHFLREAVGDWGDTRILVLTHVRELIRQNFQALVRVWPLAPAGIYSAGLNKRDIGAQILVAGIQSIHKRAYNVQRCDLVLIDEAHLLGVADTGMYRKFLKELREINPHLKVIGFTATPYRMDSGLLHEGKDRLFTDVAYEVPLLQMIEQGYLCPVVPKRTETQLDVTGVGTRGGEFIAGELERAVDLDPVTQSAVDEIVRLGTERGSWLIFASGVSHAEHVRDAIRTRGISCEMVNGETPIPERDRILGDFKSGRLRAVTNVGVLTTGFDAPGIDLIALMRPTKSLSLYVQMLGRGTRLAEGKDDCIAEGQRVLTDRGLVPIERVTTAMKVWDGVCFVEHCGAILRGEREVISYAGIVATADHKVWTEQGWKALGQCAIEQTAIAVTGHDGAPVRQDEGRFRRSGSETRQGQAAYACGVSRLPKTVASGIFELDSGDGWMPDLRQAEAGAKVAGDEGKCRQAAMHQPEGYGLREIWRAWHSVRVSIANRDGDLGAGYLGPAPRNGIGQDQQRRAVCAGQFAVSYAEPKSVQQTRQKSKLETARIQAATSDCSLFGQNTSQNVQRRADCGGSGGEIRQTVQQTKRRVWDILNAGPRHSFTVEGLLVHNCLCLDFAGCTVLHGPLDMVDGRKRGEKADGAPPTKICPSCNTIVFAGKRECPECGHLFPAPEVKIATQASVAPILSTQAKSEWIAVTGVEYKTHEKSGSPPSMRVDYFCGLARHSEWVCFQHSGYPREKAAGWWGRRSRTPVPMTVADARARTAELTSPVAIQVRPTGKYVEIIGVRFA